MSCDEPHEAACEDVLAEVWLFLDDECDGEQRRILQQHLGECRPCLERYGIEEQLKELLHRKCGGEHAPSELRNRLRATIREAVLREADVTVEHGPEGTSVEVRKKRASTAE